MDFVSQALTSPFRHPPDSLVSIALIGIVLVGLFAEEIRGWLVRRRRTTTLPLQEFPRDTAFMASIAARPRETTYLSFVAPTSPESRQGVQPVILRVFNGHSEEDGIGDPWNQIPVMKPDGSDEKPIRPSTRGAEPGGGPHHGRAATPGVRIASPASVQINLNVSAVEDPAGATSFIGTSTVKGVTSTYSGQGTSSRFDLANPPPSVYKREYKAFRNCIGVTSDSAKGGTFWFQSASDNRIAHPPDFSTCPRVRPGDLYYHRAGERPQLWMWVADANSARYWKQVELGFMREDGRRLILTDTTKIPSWIGESTFNTKHKHRFS